MACRDLGGGAMGGRTGGQFTRERRMRPSSRKGEMGYRTATFGDLMTRCRQAAAVRVKTVDQSIEWVWSEPVPTPGDRRLIARGRAGEPFLHRGESASSGRDYFRPEPVS